MTEKRAIAVINLRRYKENLLKIMNKLKNGAKLMAVVKADGYGHGIKEICQAGKEVGIDNFAVATLAEARQVRIVCPSQMILILSESVMDNFEEIVELGVSQAVYTKEFVDKLNIMAEFYNKYVSVHLKVDTGMGRIGCQLSEALDFVLYIQKLKYLKLEGIFTHFANADQLDSAYTLEQINAFASLYRKLKNIGITVPIWHAANSDATNNYSESHFDMVRIGIDSYRGVMTLKSFVGFIKNVSAHQGISYGSEYFTKSDTRIATIMIGYGDGYPRNLGNIGKVYIKGKIYPIVGRICMDMLMVDLGVDNYEVEIGDEVILMGDGYGEDVSIDNLCKLTNKISYEIMCGVQKRVSRLYLN